MIQLQLATWQSNIEPDWLVNLEGTNMTNQINQMIAFDVTMTAADQDSWFDLRDWVDSLIDILGIENIDHFDYFDNDRRVELTVTNKDHLQLIENLMIDSWNNQVLDAGKVLDWTFETAFTTVDLFVD